MALKEYKLPFGRGFQTVMLPEEHVSDVCTDSCLRY